MEGMEKIRRAILEKVKADAQQIIKEAEEKAWQEIEKAEKQKETKFQEEKRKTIEETEKQAARILAQASIRARQDVSRAKAEIINGIVNRVKTTLPTISSDEGSVLNLIEEAVGGLGADKVTIYVSRKNISAVRKLVKGDSIDNTYETRLEMLLPQILPEISRELFGGL